MLIAPKALSSSTLSREELAADKKEAVHYGHCALGKRAVYVGSFGLFSCTHYLPLTRVERVFKRLAVSKGFYEGKAFGTLSYLVVRYDGGKERHPNDPKIIFPHRHPSRDNLCGNCFHYTKR